MKNFWNLTKKQKILFLAQQIYLKPPWLEPIFPVYNINRNIAALIFNHFIVLFAKNAILTQKIIV